MYDLVFHCFDLFRAGNHIHIIANNVGGPIEKNDVSMIIFIGGIIYQILSDYLTQYHVS